MQSKRRNIRRTYRYGTLNVHNHGANIFSQRLEQKRESTHSTDAHTVTYSHKWLPCAGFCAAVSGLGCLCNVSPNKPLPVPTSPHEETLQYPPIVIKVEDHAAYKTSLKRADKGDLVPFIEFVARAVITTQSRMQNDIGELRTKQQLTLPTCEKKR